MASPAYLTAVGEMLNGSVVGSSEAANAPSLITAAGTGDAVKVTGETIDLVNHGDSGLLVVTGMASITATKALTMAAELQESSDGSSWDTAEVVYAATTVASATGENHFAKASAITLKGRKRYIRFNLTPDLTAAGTDTAVYSAAFVTSDHVLPASTSA